MEPFDHFEEPGNCQHLFLESISEPKANGLKLEVKEGRSCELAIPIEVAGQSLGEGFPVNIDHAGAKCELAWDSWVLYQVTNESFGRKEETQDGILGRLASIYRSSSLLEYVLRSAIASRDYPGKLVHYRVTCSDQFIDVVSTERPECLRIGRNLRVD